MPDLQSPKLVASIRCGPFQVVGGSDDQAAEYRAPRGYEQKLVSYQHALASVAVLEIEAVG